MAGSRKSSGRFAPGQSGNPNGRPRRTKPKKEDGSAFDVLEGRLTGIVIGGLSRELTWEEALFYRTYQDALNGNRAAIRDVLKKINEREARRSPHALNFPLFIYECPHPADVDEALAIVGIATPCEERARPGEAKFMQLEPWAVTAALARRKLGQLSQERLRDVQEHTRDAASVKWPEGSE